MPPLLPATPAERARVRGIALEIACDIHPLNNLRVLQYLKNTLGVIGRAEGRVVQSTGSTSGWRRWRRAVARPGDRPLLPRRCAHARRHLPRAAACQRAAHEHRRRAVSHAYAHRGRLHMRCRRSPTRRRRGSPTPNSRFNSPEADNEIRHSRLGPARPCRSPAPTDLVSGPPRLLRRPQLRRAREGDGRRRDQGAAVLLLQARRRRCRRSWRPQSAASAIRSRRRTSTTKSSWSSPSASAACSCQRRNANDIVFGYATGLDMTRRDLQNDMREKKRPWDLGKSFAQAAPIAPIHPVASTGILTRGAITPRRQRRQRASRATWPT